MISLSPSSLSLNPIFLSPSFFPNQAHAHPFNGAPLSFLSPAKPFFLTKTNIPNHSTFSANSATVQQQQGTEEKEEEEEEDFRVLTAIQSEFNQILILESETSKILLLDDTGSVHSILYKTQKWTNSYWDEHCSLPAIIPEGPIAIFGLGGGTVAHQLLEFWPRLVIDGWELDQVLIDQARMFFGLSELEMKGGGDGGGGILRVRVGDALSPAATVDGGYAGIMVDLFANGKVLPELEVAQTWVDMKEKLMPNGRIMVNCGAATTEVSAEEMKWEVNLTIKALCEAFGDEFVNWKRMPMSESGNYMAFTGPLPDLDLWSDSVPEKLSSTVKLWSPCKPVSGLV
ncbi:hypothetical protein SOVF_206130 [Spinacia oleracea]|uniref:PABS domain-containing protein n=1 Tax=Spinacia oleracea TaxID=3562 RepID=A0ABM3RDQ1_SPIOL|nr:uncharacterized protein LOC110782085 [Spinacia oleracea]KNA03745.1 hypothetical protein SOVF_206130 [Spinacia oleracea]